MINYKQHEIFKQLSASVYRVNTNDFSDWEEINTVNNYLTGFRAKIYKKDLNIVIAYCGSDNTLDIIMRDIEMLEKRIPIQTKNARKIYKDVQFAYPNSKIYLTGHSLGGSLAQIVGSETGAETITFSAYGTENLYGTRKKFK